jgi:WD40 repeat protein
LCEQKRPAGKELPCDESFFRFTKMSFLSDVSLAHFQLRNVFACPSRAQFIYASHGDVKVLDPISHKTRIAVNSRRFSDNGTIISALDADCGVLVAGSLHGQYCVQSLGSEGPEFHQGRITYSINGFTNHVKLHLPRRSSTPVAAIASNDEFLRLLNVETRQFVLQKKYPYALNCSAASPDRQLRVVVGDSPDIAITDTATGNILHQFSGHDDHCFACDWSDDGWAVATSAQDRSIKIWDARRWCNTRGESEPVHTILTEMAGARNLKFSPAGGGRKVLVATEASDYVNIIDATTYQSKQTFDLFGEMGNAAFISEGYGLTVLCTDPARGGALQLERCGRGIDFWDEDDIDIAPSDPSRLYGGPFRKPPRQSSRFELMAPF